VRVFWPPALHISSSFRFSADEVGIQIVTFVGFLFCIATIVALGRKKRAVATVHVGEKQLVEKAAEETA
jgi:hypothetical protein